MNETSFRQILKEFLRESEPESTACESTKLSMDATFLSWSERLSAIPSKPLSINFHNTSYRLSQRSRRPLGPKATAPRPDLTLSLEHLEPAQKKALETLTSLGFSRGETTISQRELKGFYRQAAKNLHPDRHPAHLSDSERTRLQNQFIQLKTACRELEQAFATKAA